MTRTRSYSYTAVDVFTTEPLSGNSLAVFPEASEFDAAAMQKIARELNLTETAFVLPPIRSDCAAPVRIFTTAKETPFAGHHNVGTAFVLVQRRMFPAAGWCAARFLGQKDTAFGKSLAKTASWPPGNNKCPE